MEKLRKTSLKKNEKRFGKVKTFPYLCFINNLKRSNDEEETLYRQFKYSVEILEKRFDIIYDKKKPNGTISKILDTTLANRLGWKPLISLKSGVAMTYDSFLKSR